MKSKRTLGILAGLITSIIVIGCNQDPEPDEKPILGEATVVSSNNDNTISAETIAETSTVNSTIVKDLENDALSANDASNRPLSDEKQESLVSNVEPAEISQNLQSTAVAGALEIPYPLYPNGEQYRVGGENGLKIVLFETTDTFEEVDQFYQQLIEEEEFSRLVAMSDYVRYSDASADNDPWATHLPGIVIHQFNSEDERQAVGADDTAKTNIIMSF